MSEGYTWADAVREAQEQLGCTAPPIGRTVAAVRSALSSEQGYAFARELDELDSGADFDACLDAWWTQAVVSTAGDDGPAREVLLEFADLAVSLRISRGDTAPVTMAGIESLLATGTVR